MAMAKSHESSPSSNHLVGKEWQCSIGVEVLFLCACCQGDVDVTPARMLA